MNAIEKLVKQNKDDKFICVGLDTDFEKLPLHIKSSANPVLNFNKAIIDSTSEYCAAYKINFAFYEKDGEEGLKILSETINYIWTFKLTRAALLALVMLLASAM